jgi:homoserine O-acetyltransferase
MTTTLPDSRIHAAGSATHAADARRSRTARVAGSPAARSAPVGPVGETDSVTSEPATTTMRGLATPSASALTHSGRLYLPIGDLETENSGRLAPVTIAYESWGTLGATKDNAILVEHALTGDAHIVGPRGPGQPSPGWWDGMVGPNAPLDTEKFFVICTNVLGGCMGSTGPSSLAEDGKPYGSRFPRLTIRDQIAAEIALADALGIDTFAAVIGGSMGGMRALEWAVSAPERVRRAVVIASTAAASADQIAWATPQINAVRLDPHFRGGDYYNGAIPTDGLSVARQIAHATYRSAAELTSRFGRDAQPGEDPADGGRYAVESYLEYHGRKLVERFDPNSYVVLTQAMNSHDVGRDRGGVEAALARVTADLTVASVDSDRLYLTSESDRITAGVPGARPQILIHSAYGHDGFLVEADQVAAIIRTALAR